MSCDGKNGKVGDITVALSGNRSTMIHVPKNWDATKPGMLILNFHGLLSANWQEVLLSKMNEASDAKGFIVAVVGLWPITAAIGVGFAMCWAAMLSS